MTIAPAAFDQKEAAAYLGVQYRWLDDAPIAWVDARKPGASKPFKRWRRADLDAFLAERLVQPGYPSPFGQ